MSEQNETAERISTDEELSAALENLRAIFDKERKIETDSDLLELAELTAEDE